MKIRAGFVTNSSSTSYTIIIEKEYFDEVLTKVHPYVKALFKALAEDAEVTNAFGRKVITLQWMSGNDNTLEYLEVDYDMEQEADEDDDEWEDGSPNFYEGPDKFIKELKDKDRFFMTDFGC
jgi:hypothetical protein